MAALVLNKFLACLRLMMDASKCKGRLFHAVGAGALALNDYFPELDELFDMEFEAGFAESSGHCEPEDEGDLFGFDSG